MILCAGEALVDLVPSPQGPPRALAGGAVLNTAVALGRLGEDCGFFWGLSRDAHGQMLADHLHESGVDSRLCPRVDRPTTLAVVRIKDGQTCYDFQDEGSAGRMLTPADLPRPLPNMQALFMGGISLAATPCATAMLALARQNPPHVPLFVDPNIRPAFIEDEGAYRARLHDVMSLAQIVKLSEEDLHWFAPLSPKAFVQGLLDQGVQLVCLTKGAMGAELIWADGRMSAPAPQDPTQGPLIDTIGAGDCFNAGLMAALRRSGGCDLRPKASKSPARMAEVLAFAQKVAALSTRRLGADPPWAHDL